MSTLTSFATLQPAPLAWLWPHYIPRGKLTLLAADHAAGKSLLALDLAARLSRALPLPPFVPQCLGASVPEHVSASVPEHVSASVPSPAATLLISPEDHPADTLLPRLQAAHADLRHIHLLSELSVEDTHGFPACPNPLKALRQRLRELPNLALIIIDSLPRFLSASPNRAAQFALLRGIADLAADHNLAIILTAVLPKRLPTATRYTPDPAAALPRLLDALPAAHLASSILLLAPDPNQPGRRILLSAKTNLTAPPPSLAFTITAQAADHNHLTTDQRPLTTNTPLLTWEDTPLPPHHLPASLHTPAAPPPDPMIQDAKRFILRCLAKGMNAARDIRHGGVCSGIAQKTLLRAKAELALISDKDPHDFSTWLWSLPPETPGGSPGLAHSHHTPAPLTRHTPETPGGSPGPAHPHHTPAPLTRHIPETPGGSPGLAHSPQSAISPTKTPHQSPRTPHKKNNSSDDHLGTIAQKPNNSRPLQTRTTPKNSPQAAAPSSKRPVPESPSAIIYQDST